MAMQSVRATLGGVRQRIAQLWLHTSVVRSREANGSTAAAATTEESSVTSNPFTLLQSTGLSEEEVAARLSKGDWQCPQCKRVHYPFIHTCPCEQKRSAVEQREGDWMCPKCGNLVFARKSKCICGMRKNSPVDRAASSLSHTVAMLSKQTRSSNSRGDHET
eukprot:m.213099 g.213099  ORF g.213099 m.213099 type:complete len:162 (+) comp15078_c1_seq1:270-755(+)